MDENLLNYFESIHVFNRLVKDLGDLGLLNEVQNRKKKPSLNKEGH